MVKGKGERETERQRTMVKGKGERERDREQWRKGKERGRLENDRVCDGQRKAVNENIF